MTAALTGDLKDAAGPLIRTYLGLWESPDTRPQLIAVIVTMLRSCGENCSSRDQTCPNRTSSLSSAYIGGSPRTRPGAVTFSVMVPGHGAG